MDDNVVSNCFLGIESSSVGTIDGMMLGKSEYVIVGLGAGLKLGRNVGSDELASVGEMVCLTVGVAVGFDVGSNLGDIVGEEVGIPDGTSPSEIFSVGM